MSSRWVSDRRSLGDDSISARHFPSRRRGSSRIWGDRPGKRPTGMPLGLGWRVADVGKLADEETFIGGLRREISCTECGEVGDTVRKDLDGSGDTAVSPAGWLRQVLGVLTFQNWG